MGELRSLPPALPGRRETQPNDAGGNASLQLHESIRCLAGSSQYLGCKSPQDNKYRFLGRNHSCIFICRQ